MDTNQPQTPSLASPNLIGAMELQSQQQAAMKQVSKVFLYAWNFLLNLFK